MKSIYVFFLTVSCFTLSAQNPFTTKHGYIYEFSLIDENNWFELKEKLSIIFEREIFFDQKKESKDKRMLALFSLSRLYSIDWNNEEQKKEAIKFLSESLDDFSSISGLEDKIYSVDNSSISLIFFHVKAIQIIFEIDEDRGYEILNESWLDDYYFSSKNSHYFDVNRDAILRIIYKYSFNSKAISTIEKIKKFHVSRGLIDKGNIDLFDKIELRYNLYRVGDQKKAWGYIINERANSFDLEKALTIDRSKYWRRILLEFQKIYPQQDIKLLLKNIKQEKNLKVKYLLSYSACFFMIGKATTNETPKIRSSLKKEIDSLYSKNKFHYKDYKYDFLKSAQKASGL